MVLQLLADQPPAAPFIAVFETPDPGAMWQTRRPAPEYLTHPNGATRIVRAMFRGPATAPLEDLPEVGFAAGDPRLELDLGGVAWAYS
jgi:hypothetical protein